MLTMGINIFCERTMS